MSANRRIFVGIIFLVLLVGGILAVEGIRRQQAAGELSQMPPGMPTAAPGSIPIYWNDEIVGAFTPADLEQLNETSFQDLEEGKTQTGWLLADVLELYLPPEVLNGQAEILVRSNHRGKEIRLQAEEVINRDNMVLFDLSGRGTLKLVSLLPQLDTRAEFVQDTDEIRILTTE